MLASDSLEGRGLGTDGRLKAINYIASRFLEYGLKPIDEDYFQNFEFRINFVNLKGVNIIGLVEGSNPALKNQYIVIGAHYDHLGYEIRDKQKIIFPGADDNASGVAMLLELAKWFAANPQAIGRSLVFIAFDAEESGLIGSKFFLNENTHIPADSFKLMFSLDMVGMYSSNRKLSLRGIGTLKNGEKLASEIADKTGINLGSTAAVIPQYTDTRYFGTAGIPAVHVFTGMNSPYHQPGDTYDLLDYEGMARIHSFMVSLITTLSNQPELVADFPVYVQETPRKGFLETGLLVEAGRSFHRFPEEFYRAKSGFSGSFGLTLNWHTRSKISLETGIYYDYLSSKSMQGLTSRHALHLPVNLQYNLSKIERNRLYMLAGVFYRYTFHSDDPVIHPDPVTSYRPDEYGFNFGLGAQVNRVVVGYTYRVGVNNISANQEIKFFSTGNYLTIGYMF